MRPHSPASSAALALLLGCSPGPPPRTVVLATIDTWRYDANGFLGAKSPSPTPFADALAARGLVATEAWAPVPLTGPSHWSLLSGRWPWRDGVRLNGDTPLPARGGTLAERLQGQGWSTAAFVSCGVLDGSFGFASGFDTYDDQLGQDGPSGDPGKLQRRGDATVDAALTWVRRDAPDSDLFLWLHLFDPHFPYSAPGGVQGDSTEAYLAEVAYADQQLRRFASDLEAADRPATRTLWVLLGDHGEGLGEHGEKTHGYLLHGATTHIPLVVAGSGFEPGRSSDLTSVVDVVPTVLGWLDQAPGETDGHDLRAPPAQADRALPLESMLGANAFGLAPAVGLRTGTWLWERSPRDHLWQLEDDPQELHDRAASHPDVVITGPTSMQTRLLLEDIPTGVVPYCDLADRMGVAVPNLQAVLAMANTLYQTEFRDSGRTLARLGHPDLDIEGIRALLG